MKDELFHDSDRLTELRAYCISQIYSYSIEKVYCSQKVSLSKQAFYLNTFLFIHWNIDCNLFVKYFKFITFTTLYFQLRSNVVFNKQDDSKDFCNTYNQYFIFQRSQVPNLSSGHTFQTQHYKSRHIQVTGPHQHLHTRRVQTIAINSLYLLFLKIKINHTSYL